VKPEASWYALIILKIALWITLVWCLLIIATNHSDRIRVANYEAAEDMIGPSRETLEYRQRTRLAEAINPMSGIPYVTLVAAGFLAILHSLDLIRYRLEATAPIVIAAKDASSASPAPAVASPSTSLGAPPQRPKVDRG